MAKVIFGNHSSVLVPRQDRDRIRKFYCDILSGKIMKADPESGFSTGMSLMRASSYGLQDRSGWKSNPTTLKK